MANKHRGEVGFEVDGKAYTIVFDFNAMCHLESALGTDFATVAAALVSRASATHIRALLWAGLHRHHGKGLTVSGAGDLIDTIGHTEALRIVSEALALAFPEPEPDRP